jgi:hypothetical protein
MIRRVRRGVLVRGAALVVAAALIAMLGFLLLFQVTRPVADVPVSGATHAGPNANAGTDLECGRGVECGPDNPAVRVAPSPVIGPKVVP